MRTTRMLLVSAALVLACSITLAGCGGGGGPTALETAPPAVTPTPTPEPTPEEPMTPGPGTGVVANPEPEPTPEPEPVKPPVAPPEPTPEQPIEPEPEPAPLPVEPEPEPPTVAPEPPPVPPAPEPEPEQEHEQLGPWETPVDEAPTPAVVQHPRPPSTGMLPLSEIRDGTFIFQGGARGQVAGHGSMTADMTLRVYYFTRGPSAGVNAITASFDSIVVGGRPWSNPSQSFGGGSIGSGGSFNAGGVSGQLYGPSSPDKVAPTRARGSFDIHLHTPSDVGRPNATGTWSATR